MREGDKSDTNLYMVCEGQVQLKRRVVLENGVSKQVPFAVLEAGQTFNEQAIVALYHN